MFHFDVNKLNFLKSNNKYYLFFDSIMFQDLRFGDFVGLSVYLFFIKKYIIKNSNGILNNNNFHFYFYLNPESECYIENINDLIKYFPNVWTNNKYNSFIYKFSLNTIVSNFNIWWFINYLNNCNIKIDNPICQYKTKHNIIEPLNKFGYKIKKVRKKEIIIFPVLHKKYNIERNMNTDNIIYFIYDFKRHDIFDNDISIINVNDICDGKIDLNLLRNKYNVKILNFRQWDSVIEYIIKYGKIYISGDCGLTHFVAALPNKYRPMMLLYYKTNYCNLSDNDKATIGNFMRLNGLPQQVTFIPYCPYQKSNIEINNIW